MTPAGLARLALAAMALLVAVPARAADDQGRFVEFASVPTVTAIAPPHVVVWLPPGYDATRRRYGVVYMHDGQNLFFPERSNFNKVWAADKSALRLIAARKTAPFIIVGIDQPGKDRGRQYMPHTVYKSLSPETLKTIDGFTNGPIISDDYLRFIVTELKPKIDREFRTRPDRAHTAIVGSSMGGLISLYAITRYPAVFGLAGCVSTHLPLASPGTLGQANPEIVAIWTRYAGDELGAPRGRRIWFDHGTETLDAFYAPYQEALDKALVANHWRAGRNFSSRIYPGAAHEENAWAARMDDIFGWLLAGWK